RRADRQSAGGHLPVRTQPLSELAAARLVRGAAHHREHPHPQHRGALRRVLTQPGRTPLMGAPQVRVGLPPAAAAANSVKFDVRHLDFYYGKVHALKDVNLTLADRQITAFIGPSGCGKSTLLRVFNRMYALYPGFRAAGDVRLDGEDILAPSVDLAA